MWKTISFGKKVTTMYNPYFDGHRDMPEDAIIGKWQYDEHGKKFRMVGNTKEYAPVITTTVGTMYRDEAAERLRRIKEDSDRKEPKAEKKPQRDCPFKLCRNGLNNKCDTECVFFEDTACIFAKADTSPTMDTQGRYCPIARTCRTNCALYDHGCKLTCFVKGRQPGKE